MHREFVIAVAVAIASVVPASGQAPAGGGAAAAVAAAAAVKPAPPATLAKVAISADATKRSHVVEINAETAMQLINECIAFSRSLNPNGGATVVVMGVSGNVVASMRTDGQIPNNYDSALGKAKTSLYMRQPTRAVLNRWGAPEPYLARAPLDLYIVEGGYPIIVEDLLIGSIGVGGATGDEQCGWVALTKVIGPQPPIQAPAR
jgi:uncharacterized protein GlcG (DUF336 family)